MRSRAEPFSLDNMPESVRVLTCGIDIQDNWCDWTISGFSEFETFVLANGQLHGRFDAHELWEQVDDLLKHNRDSK